MIMTLCNKRAYQEEYLTDGICQCKHHWVSIGANTHLHSKTNPNSFKGRIISVIPNTQEEYHSKHGAIEVYINYFPKTKKRAKLMLNINFINKYRAYCCLNIRVVMYKGVQKPTRTGVIKWLLRSVIKGLK